MRKQFHAKPTQHTVEGSWKGALYPAHTCGTIKLRQFVPRRVIPAKPRVADEAPRSCGGGSSFFTFCKGTHVCDCYLLPHPPSTASEHLHTKSSQMPSSRFLPMLRPFSQRHSTTSRSSKLRSQVDSWCLHRRQRLSESMKSLSLVAADSASMLFLLQSAACACPK